ncbi:kinase-like protein [Lindgomyces ingoldianus]|uniref:Kinase-like protein n=1 Tax=Lindgomyces ingoldianus TaxID=673940 RepID=A0ACB6QSX1_9PLEO|nr:kinase-like protein [Lindgomyces ingoldianus]KAF2469937.1 kinase-like protein [Lindgomyces ingoldianus]
MTMAAFSREKQVLELLNLLHHPHIVPLLTSYIHAAKFNLIFPLADASLESLLSGTATIPAITHEALWKQLLGITSALDSLHNFTYKKHDILDLEMIGYHHDLKPQNVLIKDGVFLLADFGLARLKDPVSQSGTIHKHGALTYGAPETLGNSSRSGRSVGRALDIWSWGCILIEVITLELMSPMGVAQFRQNRTTNTAMRSDAFFHSAGNLKPEVEIWIDMLRDSPITDKYRFRWLVKSTLDLVKTMLASDPKRRGSAALVHLQLYEYVKYATVHTLSDTTGELGKESKREYKPPPQPSIDPRIAAEEARENLEEFLGKDHPVMKALALTLAHADN